MRTVGRLVLALIATFGISGAARADDQDTNGLERDFMKSTALLYGQDEDGSLQMLCTATAFEHTGSVYHFVTAAHCLAEDDTTHNRVETNEKGWYITFDDPSMKNFMSAKVLGVGYQHRGDDFAVLEVEIKGAAVPVMKLASESAHLGENVINIASPNGLGKQLFRGHVSMEHLQRPLVIESINWKEATLLQMSCGPGSSGSAVVSSRQKGIVAFIVGIVGRAGASPNIVAIPVEKFKKFWEAVKAKKYKWYNPDDAQENGSDTKLKKHKHVLESNTLENLP